MNSSAAIRGRVLGDRVGTAAAALAEMVRERQFLLSDEELVLLESKDHVLAGWVFAYRVARLDGTAQFDLVAEGLRSSNARIREQACDIIGDKKMVGLGDGLESLFDDADKSVAEAARYNHGALAA